jgi:glyoxylase-like metal-dependent hydrolase (beta-lactamase superfamily II)
MAWQEVGAGVFVRRYRFYDQSIGVVLGDDGVLVVDTRSSAPQAEEIVADLRELTDLPIRAVVNTHGHYDHAFGNTTLRAAAAGVPIWGHARCETMLRETGPRQRDAVVALFPDRADEFASVEIDPPDRTFMVDANVPFDAGGRQVQLRYLGRGHTDNDIVILVTDAEVLFAGDLLENGAPPFFGDGWPIDWPATAERLVELVDGVVVPGHGDPADRAFAVRQMIEFREVAELATLVHAGTIGLEDAILRTPYPADAAREPLQRALAQLRGELVGFEPADA